MATTTARTQQHLKKLGYWCGLVERYIPQARRRIDFCGFADVLAFRHDAKGVLAVQTTTQNAVSNHLKDILNPEWSPRAAVVAWLYSGNRFEVWGWAKRGKGRKVWTVTRISIATRVLSGVLEVANKIVGA